MLPPTKGFFTALLLQLLLYGLHTYICTQSQVTTRITHHMTNTVYWTRSSECTRPNGGQIPMDLWSDGFLKLEQVSKLRNLSPLHELFSAGFWWCIHLHYISFYCTLTLFFSWPSIKESVRALLLLRAAISSNLWKRRNGTHGLKAAEDKKNPTKYLFLPLFSQWRSYQPIYPATLLIFWT